MSSTRKKITSFFSRALTPPVDDDYEVVPDADESVPANDEDVIVVPAPRKRVDKRFPEEPTQATPPPTRKKRTSALCISPTARIDSMKANPPKDYKRLFATMTLPYTEVIQIYTYKVTGRTLQRLNFCPWGMHREISRVKSLSSGIANFKSLPSDVKDHFLNDGLTEASFKPDDISVEATNTGKKAAAEFYRVFCDLCESNVLPQVLKHFKVEDLGELMAKWDSLPVPKDRKSNYKFIDCVGCFLPTSYQTVRPGPNYDKFIERPERHYNQCHRSSDTKKTVGKKKPNDISGFLKHTLHTKTPSMQKSSSTSRSQSTAVVTSKYNKKILHYDISKYILGMEISLTAESQTMAEKFAKAHTIMMVHTGISKNLSNEAVYEVYESSMKGMESYYLMNKDVGINIEPPLRIKLDNHNNNIYHCVDAIIKSKRNNPQNTYYKIKNSSFWGFSHDTITKFGKELLGVFVQGVDEETSQPLIYPQDLKRIPGGYTGEVLVHQLVILIAEIMDVKANAFEEIHSHLLHIIDDYDDTVMPPDFFKLGTILSVNHVEKVIHIKVGSNSPVGNTGDGVAVNGKAARLLGACFGFSTPSYHCCTHSNDLVIKRMTTSKTMSVAEVKTAYESLRPIVKHFQYSAKSKERLDKAMAILDLSPLNLISWGGTRMCHFMTACKRFMDVLPALHDALYSLGSKKEERDALFTAANLYVICLMADLKPHFKDKYLRKNDKEIVLVSTVHRMAAEFADKISTIETPTADEFSAGLSLDGYDNLKAVLKLKDDEHTITLNRQSRPRRNIPVESVIDNLRQKLEAIKANVMKNAVENIRGLAAKEETSFHMWSGLDLQLKISVEQRMDLLRPLVQVFTEKKIHQVLDVYDGQLMTPFMWQEFEVYLHHPQRIICLEDELGDEITNGGWQKLGSLWLAHSVGNPKPDQLTVIQNFIIKSATQYPNFCCLLLIMLATPGNTSNVERAYSILEMICAPRRNKLTPEHLRDLFLLSVMKEDIGNVGDYMDCIQYLEKLHL